MIRFFVWSVYRKPPVAITVRSGKIHSSPYKFKKKMSYQKSGRSGALLGVNFRLFFLTSLWPSERSKRPSRAAVTPVGQQNPPRRLKLSVLSKKNRQKYRL
jgi:hypothetical protein